jgi:hypothetical protein
MTTSLGITLNTRRFQDMLTDWQSWDIVEIQMLGRVAQAEAMKISPTLMKYGNRSEYHAATKPAMKRLCRKFIEGHRLGSEFEYKMICRTWYLQASCSKALMEAGA